MSVDTDATTSVAAGAAAAAPGGPDTPVPQARARATGADLPPSRKERVDRLIPFEGNARTHSKASIDKLAKLIKAFGWTSPMLVAGRKILAGHARRLAAIKLGIEFVPVIDLKHLTRAQQEAVILSDNRAALDGGWDEGLLTDAFERLKEWGIDFDLTAFDPSEIKFYLGDESSGGLTDPDDVPPLSEPVSVLGDVWLLGRHTLHCADCRDVLPTLTGIDAVVTDPPYGVNLGSHSGASERRPGLLVKAGGYTDSPEHFDEVVVPVIAKCLTLAPRAAVFGVPPNIWKLPAPDVLGGVFVPGAVGRNKWGWSNLIHCALYGSAKSLNLGAKPTAISNNDTAPETGHPTTKPTSWMCWVIDLATASGETILDPFAGSGTTIIAAEMNGRACIGIEISPAYTDVAIRRWQAFVGAEATLKSTGETFAAVEAFRRIAAKRARVEAGPVPQAAE